MRSGRRRHPVGLVNDGNIAEPGTGCFAAEVGNRNNWDEIALQILNGPGAMDPDIDVMLGGGERTLSRPGLGCATAPRRGASFKMASRPSRSIADQTRTSPTATSSSRPGIGATSSFGPGVSSSSSSPRSRRTRPSSRRADAQKKPYLLVAEPESNDNFGNTNNGVGMLAALRVADEMIGLALEAAEARGRRSCFGNRFPTTVLTAADSDASGMQVRSVDPTGLVSQSRWGERPVRSAERGQPARRGPRPVVAVVHRPARPVRHGFELCRAGSTTPTSIDSCTRASSGGSCRPDHHRPHPLSEPSEEQLRLKR